MTPPFEVRQNCQNNLAIYDSEDTLICEVTNTDGDDVTAAMLGDMDMIVLALTAYFAKRGAP